MNEEQEKYWAEKELKINSKSKASNFVNDHPGLMVTLCLIGIIATAYNVYNMFQNASDYKERSEMLKELPASSN